jgi:DNA polymerase-3 subunit gamma/tau
LLCEPVVSMSLYRKYRPQTFEDVVGQEHVARTLRNALTAEPPRVAHAYLFTGPRGIGKTTNARLMAKCLNCETGPTPTPCNKCDFCVRVTNNQPVMDLVEIDAASNTGVDSVRETIIEKVNNAPAEGRYRVYIIDEVHMLSTSSFNALLKTLEEPPAHAIFILATTDSHKVPSTILSRCQRFDFKRVTPPDIAKRLHYVAECEGIKLHEDAAKLIARHADGALRDALTLLEQVSAFSQEEITASDVRLVLGGVPEELIYGLIDGVIEQDPRKVLELLERAVDEGASFSQLCRDITAYIRDLLLHSVGFAGDETRLPAEKAARLGHSQKLGRTRLEGFISTLREAEKEMRQSSDHRLLLEITLVRACDGMMWVQGAPAGAAQPRSVAAPVSNASQPAWRAPVAPTRSVVAEPVAEPKRVEKSMALVRQIEPVVSNIEEAIEVAEVEAIEVAPPEEVEVEAAPPEATYQEYESPQTEEETVPPIAEEAAPIAETPKKSAGRGRRIKNYEDLVELWPFLLQRLRKKLGTTIVAYLHDARPVALTDDEITFEFSKEFHHAKALDAMKRLPFEEKVNEVLDKPRRLRFVLAAPKAKAAVVEEVQEDDDDDDFGTEDIIDYTLKIFAADIVGRSG